MIDSWLVLLAPLSVLCAVLLTKNLNISLIVGLVLGAGIACNFSIFDTLSLLMARLYAQITDAENLYLYAFLLILGIIISVLEYTGAALAFANRLTARLKSAKSTQRACLLLSSSLFIDDYLSCLTTGYVMRPLTDRYSLPRAKLAYLIHSLSGPLVILAPISSWLALITSQLENAGISPTAGQHTRIIADPFYIYLQSIPFIFYSWILIASVWFIVQKNISFGPMLQQEIIAAKTGNLFGGKKPLDNSNAPLGLVKSSVWDLVIPLGILVATFFIGVAWVGDYHLFGGSNSFLVALQKNNRTGFVLCISSIAMLLATLIISFLRKTLTISAVKPIIFNGISMMQTSVIMVFLASTLGIILRQDLQTGTYLAHLFLGTISLALLPLLFFILSIITALITGSAWGTIALMVPISVQMLTSLLQVPLPITPGEIPILFPVLGSIFAGAACGNHISPIAETTIMSSNSANCYPLDHFYTQLWYALPVVASTALAFICAGYLMHYPSIITITASLGIGLISCICLLLAANRIFKHS